MKALSIIQPWATLIAMRAKRIETRGYPTAFRGELAIHSSKSMRRQFRDLCNEPPFVGLLHADDERWKTGDLEQWPDVLPLGCVLAVAELVDCKPVEEFTCLSFQERQLGDYSSGRFGWVLDHVRPLVVPAPAVGRLGLWEWDPNAKPAALPLFGDAT